MNMKNDFVRFSILTIGWASISLWILWVYCFLTYVFDGSPTKGDFAPWWWNLNSHLWFLIPSIACMLLAIVYQIRKEESKLKK